MAGLVEDAAEVRDAIRACAPPVAAVGWSYGGSVIGVAATGDASVSRLIYVNDVPRPAGSQLRSAATSVTIHGAP
jgi:pimeloyl-ACP methyl ester carboxylesterase